MNILPEIPKDQLECFKVNVKEWLDVDEQIRELEMETFHPCILKQLNVVKLANQMQVKATTGNVNADSNPSGSLYLTKNKENSDIDIGKESAVEYPLGDTLPPQPPSSG